MSMHRTIAHVAILMLCATTYGDAIESWGDGTLGTEFTWSVENRILTILRGDGNDYKFWFHDGSEVPGTGVIDNITVDPNAVGDFTLTLLTPAGCPGALNWNEGDLRYAGGTSTVTGVKVDGNLGEYPYDVHIDRLEGSLEIGDKAGNVTIEEWAYSAGSKIDIAGDCRELPIVDDCVGDILIIRRIFGCKPGADDAKRGL